MHIEKLEIKGFGKINNLTLNFTKGLNIVFGRNESGKTSIQLFIKGMLFGLKGGRASKDGTLPPLKKYRPWKGSDYGGFIEYRLDNGEVYRVGRNFESNSVRVFDSLFNDITNNFEISREKGVQFAEKHLGLSDECFEKTVFIKQMESRIDNDGSRELLNRLMNVSQTGFEDVSFKKAQEALKEALKTYVGTEKTSTRPLDKLVARLEELKSTRKGILQKRDSLHAVQNELNNAAAAKVKLENRKAFLDKVRELVESRKTLEKYRKQKSDLQEILKNIRDVEEELELTSNRIEEINRAKAELAGFSAYNSGDVEWIGIEYNRLLSLTAEGGKLEARIKEIRENIKKIEIDLGCLKAFDSLGCSIEKKVLELNRDLERLKEEPGKYSVEILDEKIKTVQYRAKLINLNMLASAAFAVLLLLAGIAGFRQGFVAATAVMAVTAALIFFKVKASRELSGLTDKRKALFAAAEGTAENINKKKRMLKDIFETVGAESIEEFLRLKAAYDSKTQQSAGLNRELKYLENELSSNFLKVRELKNRILEVLRSAGVVDRGVSTIKDEYISEFKYGVRRYEELGPGAAYAKQRAEDLKSSLKGLYDSASSICGIRFDSREHLLQVLNEVSEKVESLNEELKASADLMRESYAEADLCGYDFEKFKEKVLNDCLDEVETSIGESYNETVGELSKVYLKIKECETILKNQDIDDESIQKIEEEIEELELKRNQLEDIYASLRTALNILTEASLEIQRDYIPVLNRSMSCIINRISGGRYKDLRADDRLNLKAIAPETGDVIPASVLSGGTVDQVYLSLRLAMADLIVSNGEKPPFIMDEVLAQYDDDRIRETFKFLNEFSHERQIIFFTCKGREIDIARETCGNTLNVIELP